MDFSKINFRKDSEDESSDSLTPVDANKSENKDTSKSLPQSGLNFSKLNFGKVPATPTADSLTNEPQARIDSTVDSVNKASRTLSSKPLGDRAPVKNPESKESTPVDKLPKVDEPQIKSTIPSMRFDLLKQGNVSPAVKDDEVGTIQNAEKFPKDSASLINGTNANSTTTNANNASRSFVEESDISNSVNSDVDPSDNPFLDDDDEYTLNVSEMPERKSRESSYDPDAEDSEPFLGFPKVFVGSDDKATSSSGVDNSFDDGFDDLLDDLLEDETYDKIPDVLGKSDSEVQDYVGKGVSSKAVSDSDKRELAASVARDRIRESSVREVELDADTKLALDVRRKNKIDSRAKRDAERTAGVVKEPKRVRLESDFIKQSPVEVLVDDNGRPVSKVSKVDEKSSEGVVERQRYRYMRPDGRLNGAELEFFKNALTTKSAVLANPSEMAKLRGPVGRNESEAERQERSKHIVRAAAGRNGMLRGKQPRFGQKEREVLEFLAMFRYATDRQLARMFSESQGTAYNRLKRLRTQGLVIDKKIYGNRPIWFLTEPGLIISGFDLPRITESKLTFSMFPHQFTVNNTAANLWGANVNVLHQPDYPSKFRVNYKGEKSFGESLVSELEIQSSFGKVKGFDKAEVYRPQLMGNVDNAFRDWERAGGVEFGSSPEMSYGNEYMWSLMPPYNIHLAYHVPDLVIKRDRNADGTPNSIAVEIEISNKPSDSYEKTLRAYKSDNRLYRKVIWVCKSAGPARKLEMIAKEIGLWQDGRIDIVPVITEDGVFKERDLWTI